MDIEFKTPLELYNWMHKNLKYKHTGKFLSVKEYVMWYAQSHKQLKNLDKNVKNREY